MLLHHSKYSFNFIYQFETISYLFIQIPTAMTSLYKYLLFVFLAMNSIALNAQSEVTLNIKLHPIQTLVINQAKVDINYSTKEDYTNGVTIQEPEHITVYSTGGFTVQVKASSANLVNTDSSNSETIAAADNKYLQWNLWLVYLASHLMRCLWTPTPKISLSAQVAPWIKVLISHMQQKPMVLISAKLLILQSPPYTLPM